MNPSPIKYRRGLRVRFQTPLHGVQEGVVDKKFNAATWMVKTADGRVFILPPGDLEPIGKAKARSGRSRDNTKRIYSYLTSHPDLPVVRRFSGGEKLLRVVYDIEGGEIQGNDLDVVGLPPQRGLFGYHVTNEPNNWIKVLKEDFDRDPKKAKIIEIIALPGDVLIDDVQQVMPQETMGRTLDSAILVTGREFLRRNKDWRKNPTIVEGPVDEEHIARFVANVVEIIRRSKKKPISKSLGKDGYRLVISYPAWVLYHRTQPVGAGLLSEYQGPKSNKKYTATTTSYLTKGYQKKGLYTAILKKLRAVFGPLTSDLTMAPAAVRAWEKAGGRWDADPITWSTRMRLNPPKTIKAGDVWIAEILFRTCPEMKALHDAGHLRAQWKVGPYQVRVYQEEGGNVFLWGAYYRTKCVGAGAFIEQADRLVAAEQAVLPQHQRRGIYSSVLKWARKRKGRLESDTYQTPAAQQLWKSLGAKDEGDFYSLNPRYQADPGTDFTRIYKKSPYTTIRFEARPKGRGYELTLAKSERGRKRRPKFAIQLDSAAFAHYWQHYGSPVQRDLLEAGKRVPRPTLFIPLAVAQQLWAAVPGA